MSRPAVPVRILPPAQWRARRAAHADRVEEVIGPYLRMRACGTTHPVLDFLFTYYSSRPAHVRRWHPGFGVVLALDEYSDGRDFLAARGYRRVAGGVGVDPDYLSHRCGAVRAARSLLAATAARPPRFGCFGLHEWAMVYRTPDRRHTAPLRLGADGTNAVVESMPLRCTHFDAYRFFTDPARPLNEITLTPADRRTTDQPGCLHANMDLYRTCFTLAPLLDSELTLRAFELARDAREIDMRASPYDLRALGYEPIAVENAAGRARYVREQTDIAARATEIRGQIIDRLDALLAEVRGDAAEGILDVNLSAGSADATSAEV